MNRLELVAEIVESTGLTKKAVVAALDAILETIKNAVANGDSIQFVGFGTFSPKVRSARTCRNVKTGEPVEVPEKTFPHFKAGRKFKEAVANKI